MNKIFYTINQSNFFQISNHLITCSNNFVPSLHSYVNIKEYSEKIYLNAVKFEAFLKKKLIGLIAGYENKINKKFFITNVSIDSSFLNQGIAKNLLNNCLLYCKSKNIKLIELKVNIANAKAINFYKKNNFLILSKEERELVMSLSVDRDYNKEINDTETHNYVYNFDFDVIHHYMIKSFIPFFKKGNCIELGSFKGEFTKKLLPYFDDITCVEASSDAIEESKKILSNNINNINFINLTFEKLQLQKKYDNIIMTHVLEHIDDPVNLLSKIKNEWLSNDGVLFLVCPNANAPSRQIAVKMGIISHNTAVTNAEKEHGHRITYTLDTLERDVKQAGLNVFYRTGIFFKALSNFQWDKLLKTDIISKEYLNGCYELGQQYPDLCSSIMLVCKK